MLPPDVHERMRRQARGRNIWPERLSARGFSTLVAEADGHVVGYAECGPARTSPRGWDGEVYSLYVLLEHQRRGVGRALVRAATRHLAEQGMRSISVWALATNAPSRRFYESLGAEFVEDRALTDDVATHPIAVYGWRDPLALLRSLGDTRALVPTARATRP